MVEISEGSLICAEISTNSNDLGVEMQHHNLENEPRKDGGLLF